MVFIIEKHFYSCYMFSEYLLSVMYLNVISYIYLNFALFSIIFVFNLKNMLTLSDLKNIGNLQFFSFSLILLLLSFAGVPPTIGFVAKSLMFIFFFLKKNIFIFIFISVINFFLIYFYVKNLRFLISKSNSFNFLFNNNYAFFNQNLIIFINIINFINLTSIWLVEDLLILIDNALLLAYFF